MQGSLSNERWEAMCPLYDFHLGFSFSCIAVVVYWDEISLICIFFFLEQIKLKNMLYHTARINTVAWSPDSRLVATGSLDTCAIVYEIGKPAASRITIKGAHLGGVHGLTFVDNDTLVTAGEDACIRVWKVVQQ